MSRRCLIGVLAWFGLTGCAVNLPVGPELLPLLPPQGPARRIMQQIDAHWPNGQRSLLVALELDAKHIALAGISAEGLTLFSVNYDGLQLQAEQSPLLPEQVEPKRILADLQLAFWPLTLIRQVLPQHWRVDEAGQVRRLWIDNQLRTEVNYLQPDAVWPKRIELNNRDYHYRLTITTLSYEALSQ